MIFYKVSMSFDSQIILKSSLISDMNIVAIIPLLSVTQLNSNHEWAQTRAEEVYINNAMKRKKLFVLGTTKNMTEFRLQCKKLCYCPHATFINNKTLQTSMTNLQLTKASKDRTFLVLGRANLRCNWWICFIKYHIEPWGYVLALFVFDAIPRTKVVSKSELFKGKN